MSITQMKAIILVIVTLAILVMMILVRARFALERNPNTELIIYVIQKYLSGNDEP
jgi:hypothetical protein